MAWTHGRAEQVTETKNLWWRGKLREFKRDANGDWNWGKLWLEAMSGIERERHGRWRARTVGADGAGGCAWADSEQEALDSVDGIIAGWLEELCWDDTWRHANAKPCKDPEAEIQRLRAVISELREAMDGVRMKPLHVGSREATVADALEDAMGNMRTIQDALFAFTGQVEKAKRL